MAHVVSQIAKITLWEIFLCLFSEIFEIETNALSSIFISLFLINHAYDAGHGIRNCSAVEALTAMSVVKGSCLRDS